MQADQLLSYPTRRKWSLLGSQHAATSSRNDRVATTASVQQAEQLGSESDYVQSTRTQHHGRWNQTDNYGVGLAGLPIFNEPVPNKQRLFSYTLLHQFTAKLTSETRLAYRRSDGSNLLPRRFVSRFGYNISKSDAGRPRRNHGPPETILKPVSKTIPVVNNFTYLAGSHSLKFGGDSQSHFTANIH